MFFMLRIRLSDKTAKEILSELLLHWGAGIVNLVHAYDPETIILSGGLMKSAEVIVPNLRDYVHQNAWASWGKARFVIAEKPEASVLLGISYLLQL